MQSTKWSLKDRVVHVTKLLRLHGFTSIKLTSYKPGPDKSTGWYRIEARRGTCRVVITELIFNGEVIKYSYTLLAEGKPLLRYDNAPHHPEIETSPHHKHLEDRVEPLPSPSVEAFLKEARSLLEHRSAGKR